MQSRFPALPGYDGPTKGWFHAIHHNDDIVEWSDDINERIDFVKANKLDTEIPIRLTNLMYVGDFQPACDYKAKRDALDADYKAKRAPLDADYAAKRDALYADYKAKRAPLYDDYAAKRDALEADYRAKRDALDAEILPFIKQHNPNSAWVIGSGLKF